MKIASLEIFQYTLSLLMPLKLAGKFYQNRAGIVVRLRDNDGRTGVGEVAPLPGWHQENLHSTLLQLSQDIPAFLKKINQSVPQTASSDKLLKNLSGDFFPSVGWGIDMALLQLWANQRGQPLHEIFGRELQDIIEINALLTGDPQKIQQDALRRKEEGYHTLKVKVGQRLLDAEIKLIKEIRNTLGPEVKIRLDANQAWSITDAVYFARSVEHSGIEYLEEPLRRFEDMSRLQSETDLALAMDETLYLQSPDQIQFPSSVKYLILKPTRLGDVNRFFDWVRLAEEKKLKVVISSSFESGITLAGLAHFAGMLHPGGLAMGLDTWRWFKEDLLEEKPIIRQGRIDVREFASQGQEISWDRLQLLEEIYF